MTKAQRRYALVKLLRRVYCRVTVIRVVGEGEAGYTYESRWLKRDRADPVQGCPDPALVQEGQAHPDRRRHVLTDEMPGWTFAEIEQAQKEGWDIFECSGSSDGPWQIQRIDFPDEWPGLDHHQPLFEDDADAWMHVRAKAAEGSFLHRRALAFVRENNPLEYERITSWQEDQ